MVETFYILSCETPEGTTTRHVLTIRKLTFPIYADGIYIIVHIITTMVDSLFSMIRWRKQPQLGLPSRNSIKPFRKSMGKLLEFRTGWERVRHNSIEFSLSFIHIKFTFTMYMHGSINCFIIIIYRYTAYASIL